MMDKRPVRHVPLIGDVAAGTDVLAAENVEELLPVPVDFAGEGELFMLRVRGESMTGAGILNGDYVVATQIDHPANGDIVVAGIPGGEATVKTYARSGNDVTLTPHNPTMEPMVFSADQFALYVKVVTVMPRYRATLPPCCLAKLIDGSDTGWTFPLEPTVTEPTVEQSVS